MLSAILFVVGLTMCTQVSDSVIMFIVGLTTCIQVSDSAIMFIVGLTTCTYVRHKHPSYVRLIYLDIYNCFIFDF